MIRTGEVTIGGAIVVAACIAYVLIGDFWAALPSASAGPKVDTAGPKVDTADSSMACYMAQDFIKKRLKAPATAEFQNCYGSDKAIAVPEKGGVGAEFLVKTYVDAQNSFGAKLRDYYRVELSYSGRRDDGYTTFTLHELYLDPFPVK